MTAKRLVYIALCLCGLIGFQAVVRELLANGAPGFALGFGCGAVATVALLWIYKKTGGVID